MTKIADASTRPMRWEQPGMFTRAFELHAGDEIVGTLQFRSMLGSFATGESADGCWTFKRTGFLQTKATVRTCGADAEIAVFKNNTWTGGGTVELPDGKTFLATTNFWRSKFEFQDAQGGALIEFKSGGVIHQSAAVEIQPAALALPELPWLIVLGWYLTVMMHADTAAAAAAAG